MSHMHQRSHNSAKRFLLFTNPVQITEILVGMGASPDIVSRFIEEKVNFSLLLLVKSLWVPHFGRPQIYPATVGLLTDTQLKELGVSSIGERATLRSRCKDAHRCKLRTEN